MYKYLKVVFFIILLCSPSNSIDAEKFLLDHNVEFEFMGNGVNVDEIQLQCVDMPTIDYGYFGEKILAFGEDLNEQFPDFVQFKFKKANEFYDTLRKYCPNQADNEFNHIRKPRFVVALVVGGVATILIGTGIIWLSKTINNQGKEINMVQEEINALHNATEILSEQLKLKQMEIDYTAKMLRIRAYEVELEKFIEREITFLRLFFNGKGDEILEMDETYTTLLNDALNGVNMTKTTLATLKMIPNGCIMEKNRNWPRFQLKAKLCHANPNIFPIYDIIDKGHLSNEHVFTYWPYAHPVAFINSTSFRPLNFLHSCTFKRGLFMCYLRNDTENFCNIKGHLLLNKPCKQLYFDWHFQKNTLIRKFHDRYLVATNEKSMNLIRQRNNSNDIENIQLLHNVNIIHLPAETKAIIGNKKIRGTISIKNFQIRPHIDNHVYISLQKYLNFMQHINESAQFLEKIQSEEETHYRMAHEQYEKMDKELQKRMEIFEEMNKIGDNVLNKIGSFVGFLFDLIKTNFLWIFLAFLSLFLLYRLILKLIRKFFLNC